MKIYEYEYYERWGNGVGVVIAESEEQAKQMMADPYSDSGKTLDELFPNLELREIDVNIARVIDHSWCE